MNRLAAITALRDSHAHTAVDSAIESIADWTDRWGPTMEPEEREHTQMILERLLDLQAQAVRSATRRGEVMSLRLAALEREEAARPDFFEVAASIVAPFERAA